MQQTRVQPEAFRQASAVRSIGIGVTGLVSVLSGAMLAALVMIMYLAIEMVGAAAPFVPGLMSAAVLGGYLAAAPPWFAHRTRACTAGEVGGWLVATLVGYAALWTLLVATV